jgi:hypothetical protein
VVLTVRCTSPGGFANPDYHFGTKSHQNKTVKSNGYTGEDAVKKCHGEHERLLAKLLYTDNLTKCAALGRAFKPANPKRSNSKVKRHIKSIQSWKL